MARRAKITSTSKQTRLKESEKMVQIDKQGNVTRDGKLIGKIELDESIYIGLNYITQKRVSSFDYDEVYAWLGGQI